MSVTISGIYLALEGTDVQVTTTQYNREIAWVKDVGESGCFKYLDCSGVAHYVYPGIPVLNHGDLLGLDDDDHTQYILVDGTRGFTGTVSGIYPTTDAHLTTKFYVDSQISGNVPELSNYMTIDGSKAFVNPVSGVDPVNDLHLVTKQYVDTSISGITADIKWIDYSSDLITPDEQKRVFIGNGSNGDDAYLIVNVSGINIESGDLLTVSGSYLGEADGTYAQEPGLWEGSPYWKKTTAPDVYIFKNPSHGYWIICDQLVTEYYNGWYITVSSTPIGTYTGIAGYDNNFGRVATNAYVLASGIIEGEVNAISANATSMFNNINANTLQTNSFFAAESGVAINEKASYTGSGVFDTTNDNSLVPKWYVDELPSETKFGYFKTQEELQALFDEGYTVVYADISSMIPISGIVHLPEGKSVYIRSNKTPIVAGVACVGDVEFRWHGDTHSNLFIDDLYLNNGSNLTFDERMSGEGGLGNTIYIGQLHIQQEATISATAGQFSNMDIYTNRVNGDDAPFPNTLNLDFPGNQSLIYEELVNVELSGNLGNTDQQWWKTPKDRSKWDIEDISGMDVLKSSVAYDQCHIDNLRSDVFSIYSPSSPVSQPLATLGQIDNLRGYLRLYEGAADFRLEIINLDWTTSQGGFNIPSLFSYKITSGDYGSGDQIFNEFGDAQLQHYNQALDRAFSLNYINHGDGVMAALSSGNSITGAKPLAIYGSKLYLKSVLEDIESDASINLTSGESYKINGTALSASDVGAEPDLGSSTANYILSSSGTIRSWINPTAQSWASKWEEDGTNHIKPQNNKSVKVEHIDGLATNEDDGLMSSSDKDKLDGIANNANNYSHPNHTGDVTSNGDGATTISNQAVTYAKIQNVTGNRILGRSGSNGVIQEISLSDGIELDNTTLKMKDSKSLTIMDPESDKDICLFWTSDAITLTNVRVMSTGGTSQLGLFSATSLGTTTTTHISAGTSVSNSTSGSNISPSNTSISAGRYVWLRIGTIGSETTQFHITVEYTK